jgi:hypothetical protein
MLEIYDHPWIKKYHRKDYSDNSISEFTPSEEDLQSDHEHEIQNKLMFNIQENENETTGNFVAVDMKPVDATPVKKKYKKSKVNRHISFKQ